MGRFTLPVGAPIPSDFVTFFPGALLGRTIRCVDLVEGAPERLGLRPVEEGARGITIGCVVAAPAGIFDAGTSPEGCGGFTGGGVAVLGGV